MINLRDLLVTVIRPTLLAIGMDSPSAQVLLLGTAIVESGASHLLQVKGPAVGIFQMEPDTFNDCFQNFIKFRSDLWVKVKTLSLNGNPDPEQMAGNLYLAAAMCRIKYERSPMALPDADDAAGLAHIHKVVYNSALGAADETNNVPFFEQACAIFKSAP